MKIDLEIIFRMGFGWVFLSFIGYAFFKSWWFWNWPWYAIVLFWYFMLFIFLNATDELTGLDKGETD